MSKKYRNYESIEDLRFYIDHVSAMTGEKLHNKGEIAAELAFRDELLEDALKQLLEANEVMENMLKRMKP